jgi:dihydrofolate reductase
MTEIQEEIMRKIVTGLFMSLDGVVEAPFSWASAYFSDEMFEWIGAGLPEADAILLGRRTYLEFAKMWPAQGSSVPMADFLNHTPKYVVSSTLDALEWGPAALVRGDLAREIKALKQQPGKNIQVPGSPTLVRWLLRTGLLDELSLGIAPIVVGPGMRLFEKITEPSPLQLAESGALSTGMLTVTYRPASPPDAQAGPSHRSGTEPWKG